MKSKSLLACAVFLAALAVPALASAQVTFTGTYAQSQIASGQTAGQSLSLSNATATAITGASYNYTFPAGNWNYTNSSGCSGGSLNSNGGSSTVSLTGLGVAAGATCTINFTYQPANAGVYGLSASTVTYAGGDNASPKALTAGAQPTLTVTAPTPVPTLSEWAMILLGTILAGGAALFIQRRQVA